MTVLDANVLLYAYDATAPQRPAVAQWLSDLLNQPDTIALPLVTVWAFLRISTNSRLWSQPLAPEHAFAIIREWLSQPAVVVLQPGPRHVELLAQLALEHGVRGSHFSDAVLAALTIEHGGVLASTDQDFRRFPGLRWVNPLG